MFWISKKCNTNFPLFTCLSVVLDNESSIYLHFMSIYSGPGPEVGINQFFRLRAPHLLRKAGLICLYCTYLDTEEIIKFLEETLVNLLSPRNL